MQIDYYGIDADHLNVVRFAWENFEGRFVEAYSELNQELRWFETWPEMEEWLQQPDSYLTKHFLFCPEKSVPHAVVNRIGPPPSTGEDFRYSITGWGVINFILRDFARPPHRLSSITAFSKATALRRDNTGSAEKWDWRASESAFRRLRGFVKKSAVARGRFDLPMLRGAVAVETTLV